GFEQISHKLVSLILWHELQNLIVFRIVCKASDKAKVCSLGCLNKCNTKRRAVRLPMPGNWDISLTARSNNFEENSICCEFTILGVIINDKAFQNIKVFLLICIFVYFGSIFSLCNHFMFLF